ncbi:hypothetical protein MXD62_31080 [Frankia sp. Mgl5]|uniref:hypothetical protein n=1 Tax=Frankiaceae TaxID=74712 RepID=UPI00015D9DF8|nr:hypothetical protein [Frankia sp. Mgl5]ABW11721.1 hypothetical protein Franean1_2286 [Frankia sp. EAN1pec]MCK9931530.1 hypothetical protein [Frankia sp. Mgl5]
MSARQVRRFHLERDVDVSGVSGTGSVAFGAQAPDGTCVLWWNSEHGSVAIYPSMETLLAIHGHAGMTRAVYIDSPPAGPHGAGAQPAPRAARTGGWRSVAARGGRGGRAARTGNGRPARPSWSVTTGSVAARMVARGGAARALSVQVSGRKHGTVGPSGSIV